MTITKDVLKAEIDNVQEEYLGALYKIIKVFEYLSTMAPASECIDPTLTEQPSASPDWLTFVNETYGCLRDDPIERREQGTCEVREALI